MQDKRVNLPSAENAERVASNASNRGAVYSNLTLVTTSILRVFGVTKFRWIKCCCSTTQKSALRRLFPLKMLGNDDGMSINSQVGSINSGHINELEDTVASSRSSFEDLWGSASVEVNTEFFGSQISCYDKTWLWQYLKSCNLSCLQTSSQGAGRVFAHCILKPLPKKEVYLNRSSKRRLPFNSLPDGIKWKFDLFFFISCVDFLQCQLK